MGARAPKNNGCAPPFFKGALHEIISFMLHLLIIHIHAVVFQ
jgi:hypothetical protein